MFSIVNVVIVIIISLSKIKVRTWSQSKSIHKAHFIPATQIDSETIRVILETKFAINDFRAIRDSHQETGHTVVINYRIRIDPKGETIVVMIVAETNISKILIVIQLYNFLMDHFQILRGLDKLHITKVSILTLKD